MTGWLPLGAEMTIAATIAAATVVVFRDALPRRSFLTAWAAALLLLLTARAAVGAHHLGWDARYFANDSWSGPPERSSDFRLADSTRIDDAVAFHDDTFPVHFLNDARFNGGAGRERSAPLSFEWRGYAALDAPRLVPLSLRARGIAEVSVDGSQVLSVRSASAAQATREVALPVGMHELIVRYAKPAGVAGLITVSPRLDVSPWADAARHGRGREIATNILAGAMVVVLLGGALWVAVGARPWTSRQTVSAALFAVFTTQGWWRARELAARVVTFNTLDDWFAYESRARDIMFHGPLMTLGRPVGRGDAYFFHPLYSYFVAAVHAVTGESLFGPIFVQFVILAAVATVMWRTAALVFDQRAATVAVAALAVIFELDFARYYTVTLLSENLYILTVSLMLAAFVRWVDGRRRSDLVKTAFWCGVSTVTRLPMMFYVVPALVLVAVVSGLEPRRRATAARASALAAVVWALTIAPVTLRNLIVARRFVLIADVPARVLDLLQTFPSTVRPEPYISRFHGSLASALGVLAAATWEHPGEMMAFHLRKLGFSLGMIQWFGGYKPHPELVAVSALYLAMCALSPRMRSRNLWPVHLFVATHLASMIITLPWSYGYRLIIPAFVFTTTLSVAALVSLVSSRVARPEAMHPLPA